MGKMYFPDECLSNYNTRKPSAKINKIWVEQHIYQGLRPGLKIHVDFEMSHAKNTTGLVSVYFYNKDGSILLDKNNNYSYRATNGQVAYSEPYDAQSYENPYWNDFTIFFPKDELHLTSAGTISCLVVIWRGEEQLATSNFHRFYATP